jgi:hypothetical protein
MSFPCEETLTGGVRRESTKARLPGEHLVQHESQRIEIAAHRHFPPRELLWGHIGRRAAANFTLLHLPSKGGKPEIRYEHLPAAVDHDVGRLEVTVQHAFVVRRGQACAKAAGDLDGFIPRQPPDAAQQRAQVFPIHMFHGEEGQPVQVADIVHAAHIGMRDLARDAHFGVQPGHHAFVVRDRLRQEFQCDQLSEFQVAGAVDFAHAAAANQP